MTVKPTCEELEERVRALEGKVLEGEKELRRTQEVYCSLLNSSADAVIICDLQGRTQHVSPAFTDLFGWTIEEVKGRQIPFVPDSEKETTAAVVKDLLESGKPCREFETRRHAKDGRLLHICMAASRYLDEKGAPAGILSMLRDTSEKKRLEGQLLHARKMEAVGTLAGGISHDFNNILQIISGYVQILLLSTDPSHPSYPKLQAMERAALKGSELTKRLLIFSRKVEAELRPVDLNHAVLQMAKLLERTIPKMIVVETALESDLRVINADPLQLEQIMMNLSVNAADAMGEGGRLIFKTENVALDESFCRTHVGSKVGEYVRLSVSDNGRGITPELQEHIFEPFFTTKGVGNGTGLGLAMVYGIVKSHGGYIHCESVSATGTTFQILFPVLAVDAEAGAAEERARGEIPFGSGERILVVDDEKLLLDMVGDLLVRFGYLPILAESGEEALEILKREKSGVDLAILDLSMPGMGGFRCLKEMVEMVPGLKVIIASGYSANRKVSDTVRSGAAGFIEKPYHYNDILKKIRDSLKPAGGEGSTGAV